MADKTPEEDGYESLIVIKEGSLGLLVDLLNWMEGEWFPENGYDFKNAIIRNTQQGHYEIMAKRNQ